MRHKQQQVQISEPSGSLLQSAYNDGESFRYSVSWMGIKAGELYMEIKKNKKQDTYTISTTVKSAGLLGKLYPVEDVFETIVSGKYRLPTQHTMLQQEGSRRNIKITSYDQELFLVSYQKNDSPAELFQTDGQMHNEFSSFLYLRVLPFTEDKDAFVPTFADKKRHNVLVTLEAREKIKTIFGEKNCLQVRPHLSFQGLYKKVGDPLIWLTDDSNRIPMRIKAKIVIGSLTANIESYSPQVQPEKANNSTP